MWHHMGVTTQIMREEPTAATSFDTLSIVVVYIYFCDYIHLWFKQAVLETPQISGLSV